MLYKYILLKIPSINSDFNLKNKSDERGIVSLYDNTKLMRNNLRQKFWTWLRLECWGTWSFLMTSSISFQTKYFFYYDNVNFHWYRLYKINTHCKKKMIWWIILWNTKAEYLWPFVVKEQCLTPIDMSTVKKQVHVQTRDQRMQIFYSLSQNW